MGLISFHPAFSISRDASRSVCKRLRRNHSKSLYIVDSRYRTEVFGFVPSFLSFNIAIEFWKNLICSSCFPIVHRFSAFQTYSVVKSFIRAVFTLEFLSYSWSSHFISIFSLNGLNIWCLRNYVSSNGTCYTANFSWWLCYPELSQEWPIFPIWMCIVYLFHIYLPTVSCLFIHENHTLVNNYFISVCLDVKLSII